MIATDSKVYEVPSLDIPLNQLRGSDRLLRFMGFVQMFESTAAAMGISDIFAGTSENGQRAYTLQLTAPLSKAAESNLHRGLGSHALLSADKSSITLLVRGDKELLELYSSVDEKECSGELVFGERDQKAAELTALPLGRVLLFLRTIPQELGKISSTQDRVDLTFNEPASDSLRYQDVSHALSMQSAALLGCVAQKDISKLTIFATRQQILQANLLLAGVELND